MSEHTERGLADDTFVVLAAIRGEPFELTNLAAERPDQCAALRARLLVLLRQSRDPYWDVLIEHGVEPDGPVVDVSERPGRRLAHLR